MRVVAQLDAEIAALGRLINQTDDSRRLKQLKLRLDLRLAERRSWLRYVAG